MKCTDLVGRIFGRLTVISRQPNSSHRNESRWLCRCECGAEKTIIRSSLKAGRSLSCGCLFKERITKHGASKCPEYDPWRSMLDRCTNPNSDNFPEYGGRGIRVCERWKCFDNFIVDVGPRPSMEHSLDRYPDNNGHYEPTNVRWATRSEQMLNTRYTHRIFHNGENLALSEWSRKLNISIGTLFSRIKKGKVGEELFAPVKKSPKSSG